MEALDICRANAAFIGGTGAEDNNVVAALSATGPLAQVSSGGGQPRAITELDFRSGEPEHLWAQRRCWWRGKPEATRSNFATSASEKM
jgi:hypothetical protein